MSTLLATWIVVMAGPAPRAKDVVAGWGAFWLFVGGIVAVALLGWSLVRQLRKAQAAKDAGVYGDEPVVRRPAQPEDADHSS